MASITDAPGAVMRRTEARGWGDGLASLGRALGSVPGPGLLLSAQRRTRVGSGSQQRVATRRRPQEGAQGALWPPPPPRVSAGHTAAGTPWAQGHGVPSHKEQSGGRLSSGRGWGRPCDRRHVHTAEARPPVSGRDGRNLSAHHAVRRHPGQNLAPGYTGMSWDRCGFMFVLNIHDEVFL